MQTIKVWQSWTVWFNIAMLIVAFVPQVNAVFPLPAGFVEMVAMVGNLLLRVYKTTTAIDSNLSIQ